MEDLFKQAMSFPQNNEIETEADTFLAVAIAHNVFKTKILEKPKQTLTNFEKAEIFNNFHKSGLNPENTDLMEKILSTFALENGIEPPKFELQKADLLSKQLASASPQNIIRFYQLQPFSKQAFPKNIESIAHESQHLLQFFCIKKFLTGNDVDIQYKIMAFQQIFNFCQIKASRFDFITNNKYWYNAMEIDARKVSAEYLMDLIKNPHLSPQAHNEIVNFVCYKLNNSANLYDAGAKLLEQLNWQSKKFGKIFNGCPLATMILTEYKNAAPEMERYARELDIFAKTLPLEILLIKQNEKKENNQPTRNF